MARHYRRRYRHRRNSSSSIFALDRSEKMMFQFFIELIGMIAAIITFTCNGIYKIIIYINKRNRDNRILKRTGYKPDKIIKFIYEISPRQFEVFCAQLFIQHGYSAKLTAPTCDYGRDIILDGNIYVECKHFSKNNYIGRPICQKLLGAAQMFNAKRGIIITTGTYHKNAYEVAAKVDNLKLMDINDIKRMIFELEESQINKVMSKTLNAS